MPRAMHLFSACRQLPGRASEPLHVLSHGHCWAPLQRQALQLLQLPQLESRPELLGARSNLERLLQPRMRLAAEV